MNGWHLSPLEWFAAFTALLCVWLTVKTKISNWFWGIVSTIAYAFVFWQSMSYANMWLQIVYFLPCCAYGWHVWLRYGPTHNDDLPVTKLAPAALGGWCVFVAALTPALGLYLSHTPDPLPYTDSFLTAMSIAGQYLQAKKIFENWHFWLVADSIYAFYFFPALKQPISAVVYGIFLVLVVKGLLDWRPLINKPVRKTREAEA